MQSEIENKTKQPTYVLRAKKGEKNGKTYWMTIGAAWQKENGNISISLDALPVKDTNLVLVPKKEKPVQRTVPYGGQ